MAEHILRCGRCSVYTMAKVCLTCGIATIASHPPKYSLDDKYANYRREEKKKELILRQLY